MKAKNWIWGAGLLVVMVSLICIYSAARHKSDDKEYTQAFINHYRIFSLPLPAKVAFCGEEVPLDLFYVREALERELLVNVYWNSNLLMLLKRSCRWFPVIEPILKKNKVPCDFKYLALAESGFTLNVSPAGAAGFWQFIKTTGKKYGLEINADVDERYHVEKATQAACDYFLNAYSIFQNWTLTAACFNSGDSGMKRQVDFQGTDNYYDLALSAETARYIYRILALKLICESPQSYGYYLRMKDVYPPVPVYKIKVDTTISNLAQFAKLNKVSYKVLKEFNPWLRSRKLNNPERKTYEITFPQQGFLSNSRLIELFSSPDTMLTNVNVVNYNQ